MITLKCLNVVRQVATEEQALKLAAKGFIRTGGTAEGAADTAVTEADMAKLGEAMYERLSQQLQAAVQLAPAAPTAPVPQGKAARGGGKEVDQNDAGADQPDRVNGAK